ncbi:MAG: tripartite tricarboxylate transporter permease [Oscillospiraceae bacterium]
MDLILQVAQNVFSPFTLLICFIGTALGVILGAIPGLNGGIGIAVMLPFTYSMDPAQGLLFLGGMYLGSSYGGSISGILINCPGTAESACTTLEGYPMTRRGEGKRALYFSIIASGVGSVIGLTVLLFFTQILSKVSVKFGPPEMMLLAICGLSIVGSLTGKNVIKGLIAAMIGLLLAMIGIDNTTGALRFTFGLNELRGGIGLIPAVIGLFAIAEMIKQGMRLRDANGGNAVTKLQQCKFSTVWKDTWKNFKGVLLKSSIIGTFIGVLPGTGGAIASFLAYGEAKGKDKEGTFGNGNPAGIIASESANNAAVGGSLVPMLALGIPGSATSAIMFGALTIHGLVPGQRLFVEHADIAYTFLIGMFVTVVFMMIIGCFGIPLFAKVLKLNIRQIIPVVILCSLVGAYSVNNSLNDVFVAIGCGVLGVVLSKLEIPTTPIVLGLILGGLIESNFIRTQTIVHSQGINFFAYVFTRPLCLVILALTVYLIYTNIKAMKRGKKIQQSANITQDPQEEN